ncbi:MAG TPA: hypothetical protein VFT45_04045 [Longimicrobium sp.]|nr:hypothetical protein [Longimicrobium sp.]
MPRLTLFLAAALLAGAPSSLRAQPGGTTPSRPVDECGKPAAASARPRRGAPATTSSAPARPPRLLGTPVGETAAGSGAAPGTSGSAASGAQSSATAGGSTPHAQGTAGASSTTGAAGSPASGTQSSATAGGSTPHAQGTAAASGTSGAAGSPAPGSQSSATAGGSGVQGATGTAGGAQQGAASSTAASGTATQASSTSVETAASGTAVETAASSTSAGSQFLSAGGAPGDGPIDPRAARRNRDALQLGLGKLGDRKQLGPAASVSVPTGFGVDGGEMFFGVAYQGRTRYTDQDDAAAVAGLGIGTRRLIALEAAVTTYSTFRSYPLETGGLSLKLHRALPRQTSVAVGWENAVRWGGSDDDGSLYGVVTRLVNLRQDPEAPLNTAVLTLGVGNGRFRFEDDDADKNETVNVFAAAGARITPQVSLVADWTGQDLNAAASLTPLPRIPMVVTVGLADLTGSAGDGARFILSLGYGLAFRAPSF